MQCKLNEANERVAELSATDRKRLRGAFEILQAVAFHLKSDAYSEAADAIESLLVESTAPGVAETTEGSGDGE